MPLAARVGVPRPDRVLTSPATAALETAEALGLSAVAEAPLRDVDHGRWRGRAFADVAREEPEAIAAWLADPGAAPHGGESLAVLLGRLAAWLDGRRVAANGARVLLVTHAAVIRAAVLHAIGAPPAAFWRLDVAPLSRTVLQGDGVRWTLAALNVPLLASPDRANRT